MGFFEQRVDVLLVILFFVAIVALALAKKLPTVQGFSDFVHVLNTPGGLILVLGIMTMVFFEAAIRMFYHCIYLVTQGKLDEKSAVLMMGIQFVTGAAFGGAAGVLYKTMDGSSKSVPPSSEAPKPPTP
jgi:hypothetical protein